jgi:hypothetical protein
MRYLMLGLVLVSLTGCCGGANMDVLAAKLPTPSASPAAR